MKPLSIGTRGSPLARKQVALFIKALQKTNPYYHDSKAITVKIITTDGDRFTDRDITNIGGKAVFVSQIEDSLLAKKIDCAVHSMKDMPAILPTGCAIGAVLPRADSRDAIIAHPDHKSWSPLVQQTIGTSSPRRAAQLRQFGKHITVVPLRGNIETRMQAVHNGRCDATILALAGLQRMGYSDLATFVFNQADFIPAVGQGAIGIEYRRDDEHTGALLDKVNHRPSAQRLVCERAMLAALGGSCHTPIGARTTIINKTLTLEGMVATLDGKYLQKYLGQASLTDGAALGIDIGQRLKKTGILGNHGD